MSQRRSVWLATFEPARHPSLDADVDVDVAVVGGGITGLTTALLLQRHGARVAVVEAERIGGGTTGHTTGKVTSQHGLTYHGLVEHLGEVKARLYADANQQAIETIATLADETAADCRFERAAAYVYATSADERQAIELEHAAAVRLGLPATLTDETDLPFPVELALRFDDQAHIHAARYADALARAILAGGGVVFERSRATDVDEGVDGVVVHTAGGDVRAGHAVLATLLPFVDRGGFFAKARPSRAYGISARLRTEAPAGMHISAGSPTRSTRPWVEGDRLGLVVVGENHPTGEGDPTPGRWGDMERWTREHFDVESFEHRWSSQDYVTVDDVPYVGLSPRMSRTFVATGFKKWGLTNGTAAAVVLAEAVNGREHPWLDVFDAGRIGDAATVKKLVEDNLHVAKRLVGDRIARLRADSVDHLEPGEGEISDADGETVAAYRDAGGALHAVSATCTHLGCTVQWNAAEASWDCPCHGSRFSPDGDVLDGPAVKPLAPVDVDGSG